MHIESNEVANSRYLKVEGLSRTALPSDLRRLCVKSRVENIESSMIHFHHPSHLALSYFFLDIASLNYRRFSPTQEGFIVLNNPGHANPALKALRENVVGGFRVTTTSVPSLNDNTPIRSRGRRGRDEAMERGIITGDGPNAGITDRGKSVVIYGLPGKMTAESLRSYLKTFKFGSEDGTQSIMKIPVCVYLVSL